MMREEDLCRLCEKAIAGICKLRDIYKRDTWTSSFVLKNGRVVKCDFSPGRIEIRWHEKGGK